MMYGISPQPYAGLSGSAPYGAAPMQTVQPQGLPQLDAYRARLKALGLDKTLLDQIAQDKQEFQGMKQDAKESLQSALTPNVAKAMGAM